MAEVASYIRLGRRNGQGHLVDDQDDLDIADFGGSIPLPGERFVRWYKHPDGSLYYKAFRVVERIYRLDAPGKCAIMLVAEEVELAEDEESALALPIKNRVPLDDQPYEVDDYPDS